MFSKSRWREDVSRNGQEWPRKETLPSKKCFQWPVWLILQSFALTFFLWHPPLPYGWHIGGCLVTGWNCSSQCICAWAGGNPLLQGSQAVQLAQLKLLPPPYLSCWIFLLRAPPLWGAQTLSPLLALHRKSRTALLAAHLAIVMARESRLITHRWRLGVNTALHGTINTRDQTQLWTTKAGIL